MSRFNDGTYRAPADVFDHLQQADIANKMAENLFQRGRVSEARYWKKVARQKTTDAIAVAPKFMKQRLVKKV